MTYLPIVSSRNCVFSPINQCNLSPKKDLKGCQYTVYSLIIYYPIDDQCDELMAIYIFKILGDHLLKHPVSPQCFVCFSVCACFSLNGNIFRCKVSQILQICCNHIFMIFFLNINSNISMTYLFIHHTIQRQAL